MGTSGQYETIYDQYSANYLDSQNARITDLHETVPIAGFTASLISAINNAQVILSGFHPYSAFDITWNGLPPPNP